MLAHNLTVVKGINSAPWETFSHFLSSADFFSKLTFSKNYFRNTIRKSNSMDPGQAQHFVQPDLNPNCMTFHGITEIIFLKSIFKKKKTTKKASHEIL